MAARRLQREQAAAAAQLQLQQQSQTNLAKAKEYFNSSTQLTPQKSLK